MRIRVVLTVALLFVSLRGTWTRAQDAGCTNGAAWRIGGVPSAIAVSRDGRWVCAKGAAGFQLFPAKGGAPIQLDPGKTDAGSDTCAFTADSKWLVVPGDHEMFLLDGVAEDRTQSIFVFSTVAPFRCKDYDVKLKVSKSKSDLARRLGPLLEGGVTEVVPVSGARALLDRHAVDPELWDVSTGGKIVMPSALGTRWFCGLSEDATRAVRHDETGFQIREVKGGRVLLTVKKAANDKSYWCYPTLARDGSCFVALSSRRPAGAKQDTYTAACWSAVDGTRLWSTALGGASFQRSVEMADGRVVVMLSDSVHVLDLADGAKVAVDTGDRSIVRAVPSADGKCLWARLDDETLRHVHLPPRSAPPEEK